MAVMEEAPPGAASILCGSDLRAAGLRAPWGRWAWPHKVSPGLTCGGQAELSGPGSHSGSVQKLDSARKARPTLLANPVYIQVGSSEGQDQPAQMVCLLRTRTAESFRPPLWRERGWWTGGRAGCASCVPGHCPPGKVLQVRALLPSWQRGCGQLLRPRSWQGCSATGAEHRELGLSCCHARGC